LLKKHADFPFSCFHTEFENFSNLQMALAGSKPGQQGELPAIENIDRPGGECANSGEGGGDSTLFQPRSNPLKRLWKK